MVAEDNRKLPLEHFSSIRHFSRVTTQKDSVTMAGSNFGIFSSYIHPQEDFYKVSKALKAAIFELVVYMSEL